jgi:hypothetical protein
MGKAILATMQHMTSTLSNLQVQMSNLNANIGGLREERTIRDQRNVGGVTSETLESTVPGNISTAPFHAVAHGANGHQGIYRLWSEASPWVTRVPGNVHQKFHTVEEAQTFIENFNITRSKRGQPQDGGNLFSASPGNHGGGTLSGGRDLRATLSSMELQKAWSAWLLTSWDRIHRPKWKTSSMGQTQRWSLICWIYLY